MVPLENRNATDTLILFTHHFPYGSGEAFIEKEIPVLSERFREVIILPFSQLPGEPRNLPPNVRAKAILREKFPPSPFLWLMHGKATREICREEISRKSLRPEGKKFFLSLILQNQSRSVTLRSFLQSFDPATTMLYSYWTNEWVTIAGLAMRKMQRHFPIISRAHGFDVYEERHGNTGIPFRKFQLETCDRIFCVSADGKKYLSEKYPAFANKIEVARLGVEDHGLNPYDESAKVMVSCSSVIPLKRVELIPEILAAAKLPLKWIHFGDGPSMHLVKTKCRELPPDITVELRGQVSNAALNDFYRSNPVSLFLNVSVTEGIPVSIMEAISFGIPVLAPAVGGIPEIVTAATGELFAADEGAEKTSERITAFFSGPRNHPDFRQGARQFWSEHYNAGKNFHSFCDRLEEIKKDSVTKVTKKGERSL